MKQYLPPYKGYYGSINIDPENNILYGKIEFIRAVVSYEANDAKGLLNAFQDSVNDYLDFCEKKNIEPEQPFKGSLNVRIGKDRHRKAWQMAQALEKTLNEYICQALDKSFEETEFSQNLPKRKVAMDTRKHPPEPKNKMV